MTDQSSTTTTSTPSTTTTESKETKRAKRPMSEQRRAQLAAAREKHRQNAAERRRQKRENKYNQDVDMREEKEEVPSSRLVRDNGESSERYLKSLKSFNEDIQVTKSEPRNKKRKVSSPGSGGVGDEIDMKTAFSAGLGLAVLGAATYLAGKNLNAAALRAGFTSHGSAIPGDPSTGQAAIPTSMISPDHTLPRPLPPMTVGHGVPSLGLFG